MFMCPTGWREWRNGDLMTYVPREGKAHCVITYAERISPVHSLPYHLYRVLDEEPEFTRTETFEIARFVSNEGEYGARIVCKGVSRGIPIGLVVAGLFTEDFSTRLVGRVELPFLDQYIEMITNLAQNDRLELGVRRRRVAYQPPPGWHPVTGDLDASFFPPEYPKPRLTITVNAAEPISLTNPRVRQEEHDARVGLAVGGETVVTQIYTPKHIRGDLVRTTHPFPGGAGKMVRHLGVLSDSRYWYSAKLEAMEQPGLDPYVETLMNLLGSIESIPAPTTSSLVPTAFDWID